MYQPLRLAALAPTPAPTFPAVPPTVPAAAQADAALAHWLTVLVDEVDCGLLLCSAQGLVRYANHAARCTLAQQALLRLDDGRLQAHGLGRLELDNALGTALLRGRRQLVVLAQGDDRLMVTVMPLPGLAGADPVALVVLGRRGLCSPLGLEMLAGRYGLTLREQRVLGALLSGQAPRAIAQAHGVKVSTIRTQVAAIRAKLGTSSVESLLLMAGEVPPLVSALRGPAAVALAGWAA